MLFSLILTEFLNIFFFLLSLQNYVNGLRFILTVLGGTIAVMGSKTIGYPSAGALGCVTVAFIAGIGWKRQEKKLTPKQLEAYETVSFSFFLYLFSEVIQFECFFMFLQFFPFFCLFICANSGQTS